MTSSRLKQTISVATRSLGLVEEGWSERGAMRHALKENPGTQDRREVFKLVMDTLARKSLVDHILESLLGKTLMDRDPLSIARLSVVLFLFSNHLDRGEALDGLRASCPLGFRHELERLAGDLTAKNNIDSYLYGTRENQRLALMLGYPEWWIEYCIRLWGRYQAIRLFSSGNRVRPRYLHVNSLRLDGHAHEHEFASLPGLKPVDSLPGSYLVLTEGLPAKARELVERGILESQDLPSYLAVKAGAPTESDTVLDVCAAPGGKTGALSQEMHNKGTIVSVEYSRGRMRDWKRMANTLGVENASGVVEDASRPALKDEPIFDLVLVDPPCSGSGIFEKNPAMKWHLSPQRLGRYADLQYRLLQQSSRLLKSDGRIVYSTCSISLEENEHLISRFIAANPEFETRPVLMDWGHPGLRGYVNCRRFYPHLDMTAGYFIARLERIS